MWEGLTVGGFQFDDSLEYAGAKKESDIINYIIERMNISDPQIALKVYYKLLERQDMKSVIGLAFLKQLRDFCIQSGIIDDSQIKLIPVSSDQSKKGKLSSYGDAAALEIDSGIHENSADMDNSFEKLDGKINEEFAETEKNLKRDIRNHINQENKFKQVADYYRYKVKKCFFTIAGLVVIIIALFVISLASGNSALLDKEAEVQDKYASWAEELNNKEIELAKLKTELEKKASELIDLNIDKQMNSEEEYGGDE